VNGLNLSLRGGHSRTKASFGLWQNPINTSCIVLLVLSLNRECSVYIFVGVSMDKIWCQRSGSNSAVINGRKDNAPRVKPNTVNENQARVVKREPECSCLGRV
jgi:hypothetical protein